MKQIYYDCYQTPLGMLSISATEDAIIGCCYDEKVKGIKKETPTIQNAYHQIEEYFQGKRQTFDVQYQFLTGTKFQQRVWKSIMSIPYGEVASYQDIAILVGSPKAYRAVGNATNHNPLAIFVPCHRVIGAHGRLGGYGGEIDKKIYLLNLEGVCL